MATRQVRRVDFVDPRGYEYYDVDIDVLVPDPENPRIPPQEFTPIDTMLAILRRNPSGLQKLAEDLAKYGTNPAELLNVTRLSDKLFLVKEGNRRLTARKLLRNPEQLRGHVTPTELRRWQQLKERVTTQLSTRQLIVVGEDHEHWVYIRHQGYLGGLGHEDWDRDAKFRHQLITSGKRNRALALMDALKANYPDRFPGFPKGSFSIFERFMNNVDSRARLGVDVDDNGHLKLTHGERSLRMLEEIVRDVKKLGDEKLTTRKINLVADAHNVLQEIEGRIGADAPDDTELVLPPPDAVRSGRKERSSATVRSNRSQREPDILKSFHQPDHPRIGKIFQELGKARRNDSANAAMILTRVLLELSINAYSDRIGISFEAGDTGLKDEITEVRRILSISDVKLSKKLSAVLKRASTFPPELSEKLEAIITDLQTRGRIDRREAEAKRRELHAQEVIPMLNDAVHRLLVAPSMERVDQILKIIQPIFNEMHP